MELSEQCDVADFLLDVDPVRLIDVASELVAFVSEILVCPSTHQAVVVRFLKLFVKICDRNTLERWMSDEPMHCFIIRAWEMAEEYDDDELIEFFGTLL